MLLLQKAAAHPDNSAMRSTWRLIERKIAEIIWDIFSSYCDLALLLLAASSLKVWRDPLS